MELNDDVVKNLVELTKKKIKSINKQGSATIIEFENGEIIPLFGGQGDLNELTIEPTCSFCGIQQSNNNPLMGPPNKTEPLICAQCATKAVETFVQNGIEIELDVSIFPDSLKHNFLNGGSEV
ncbi:hypothetical protein D3C81_816160 [compost metagenome]